MGFENDLEILDQVGSFPFVLFVSRLLNWHFESGVAISLIY